jgi:hypothetical protein
MARPALLPRVLLALALPALVSAQCMVTLGGNQYDLTPLRGRTYAAPNTRSALRDLITLFSDDPTEGTRLTRSTSPSAATW